MVKDESTLGWGDGLAPPGSLEYAKRWRLDMLSAVKAVDYAPDRLRGYLSISERHPTWSLLTDGNGRRFDSFDAFCAAPEPHGLGSDPKVIRQALRWKLGAVGAAAVTLPRAEQGKRTDLVTSGTECPKSDDRTAKQIRAVLRSPETAQALVSKGLLGQKEAAKLGPKNPTPEQAARVTAIAIELAADAKAVDASTEALRKQAQRALNAKARDLLGVRVNRVEEALRSVEKMTDEERVRFVECVMRRWPDLKEP